MKICVFSDIHGNGPAFRVAYDMILSEKADLNVFLGDLCGYYYDQLEIFTMFQNIPNLIAIKGNHDETFLRVINKNEGLRQTYIKKYGNSMENLLGENDEELTQWLLGLPESYIHTDSGLAFYHGSPWDYMDGYVYPDSPLDKFLDYPSLLFVLGHTHYPMTRTINDKLIVNPGSLGQPRHGGWPTYALIEDSLKKVVFREVPYEKPILLSRIDELDSNNKYLKEVILR
jgi:putative phosphoesterase